jgi:hypothetical protein
MAFLATAAIVSSGVAAVGSFIQARQQRTAQREAAAEAEKDEAP